ncbi:MAG TPA: EamA family transporter [Thermoanaerobaculia bacterium]|nr:EamA family transporter [Thermoanaerobaculia bacterium]
MSLQPVTQQSGRMRGALLGLGAAALFGASAPVSKLLLGQTAPQMLAALLYLGAGAGLLLVRGRRRSQQEAPLRSEDWPYLAGIVITGGMIGPVLMLHGLRQVSGVAGSLLLNLEAPFTIAVAVLFFGEHLARREATAAAIIILGGATLTMERDAPSQATVVGVLLLAGACAAWAVDNNLTQKLSLKDPFSLVRIKTLSAGTVNLLIALALGQQLPSIRIIAAAAIVGFVSYGVSILLDAYALRDLGAAREAAFFSTAPFFGAALSIPLLGETLTVARVVAVALMSAGVVLLLRARHGHTHEHVALDHEHRHVHDEHHQHEHLPTDPPGEPHSHPHRHAPLAHEHPHVSDVHHRHGHG